MKKQGYTYRFSAVHHNTIAKEIREHFPIDDIASFDWSSEVKRKENMIARGVLGDLALSFAKRFKQDNNRFNPIKFLDACSPDTDLYPLSELWEDDNV